MRNKSTLSLAAIRREWNIKNIVRFLSYIAAAFLINLGLEMLSRRSFTAGIAYLTDRPWQFFYDALIILFTLSLSLVFRKRGFSDETPYESRFFSVLLDEAGRVLGTDTGKIAAVDQAAAAEYAQEVWRSGQNRGFWEEYRFIRSTEAGGIRIIFLDCGRSLFIFHAVLLASISIALLGLLAVLVLLILFSGRIVTPAAESSLFPVSRHKPNEYFVLCLHFPVRDPIMKATYLRRARGGIAMRSF